MLIYSPKILIIVMKNKIKIILRKDDGTLGAYLVRQPKLKKDSEGNCYNCLLTEKCNRDNSEIYFSKDKDKYFIKIPDNYFLCETLEGFKDLSNYKEIPVPKNFLVKKLNADYGDDESDILCDEGFVFLSPSQLIETFCKKVCPGYKENLLCMRDLGCPFYDFMNDCYKIVENDL